MSSIESWLVKSLANARLDEEEEQGKVTLRIGQSWIDRLDTIARSTGQSRTRTATELLQTAIGQAHNLLRIREEDPVHYAELVESMRESELEEEIAEGLESGRLVYDSKGVVVNAPAVKVEDE